MAATSPVFDNHYGQTNGDMDLLPKPVAGKIPMLITGGSQQEPEWGASHGDGWITYPRDIEAQATVINA